MGAFVTFLQSLNPFVLLLVAISTEIAGTTALRMSAGFTRLWPSAAVVVSYILSFYLYSLVIKQIPMGVAYAVWAGLGTAGVGADRRARVARPTEHRADTRHSSGGSRRSDAERVYTFCRCLGHL